MSLVIGLAAAAGLGVAGPAPQPVVSGSIDKSIIQRVIHAHLGEIRGCYERALVKKPTLAGRVNVHFVIAASGAVSRAEVTDSTLGEVAVDTCLTKAISLWTFPAPPGGGVVKVSYPFVFRTPATTDSATATPPSAALPVVVADRAHDVLVDAGRVPYRLAAATGLAIDVAALNVGDANAIVLKLGGDRYSLPLALGKSYYVLDATSLSPLGDAKPFAGFGAHQMALLIVGRLNGDKLTERWTANLLFAPR